MRARPWWAWALIPMLLLTLAGGVLSVMGRLDVSRLLFPGADKVLHFVLYGGVAFGAVGWLVRWRGRAVMGLLILAALADEVSQAWFPTRSVDALDAACSIAGIVVLGVLARSLRGPRLSTAPARLGAS